MSSVPTLLLAKRCGADYRIRDAGGERGLVMVGGDTGIEYHVANECPATNGRWRGIA